MGDPVSAGIIGLSVGGATQSVGTYLGGRQQRNALKMETAQLRTQKKAMETNAAIEQAERMNRLKEIMATQNAIYAMTGQNAGVGSASAIQAASMSNANREQRISNLQKEVASSAYDYNIWSAKKGSRLAMGTAAITSSLDFLKNATPIIGNMIGGNNKQQQEGKK